MSKSIATLGFTVAIATLGGISAHHPNLRGPSYSACGPLRRWKMPETTQVNATADESRSYDSLVTEARIDAIILASEAYCRLNDNRYPGAYKEMIHPPEKIARRMHGCLLDSSNVSDSWGRPIYYGYTSNHVIVRSPGPDGRFTTEDDIGTPSSNDAHTEPFDIARECH